MVTTEDILHLVNAAALSAPAARLAIDSPLVAQGLDSLDVAALMARWSPHTRSTCCPINSPIAGRSGTSSSSWTASTRNLGDRAMEVTFAVIGGGISGPRRRTRWRARGGSAASRSGRWTSGGACTTRGRWLASGRHAAPSPGQPAPNGQTLATPPSRMFIRSNP